MNRQITSPNGCVQQLEEMPEDKGRITEEPCAIKVARTVLEQRWTERICPSTVTIGSAQVREPRCEGVSGPEQCR